MVFPNLESSRHLPLTVHFDVNGSYGVPADEPFANTMAE